MRPLVGISGPDRGGYPAWFFTSWAIRFAGGRPLRLTPHRGLPVEPLHALVLGGGADVDPLRYGEIGVAPPLGPELRGKSARSIVRSLLGYVLAPLVYLLRRLFSAPHGGLDRARDELETELLARALRERAPVLGICWGAQLINVHLGGTLYRDVGSFYVEAANPWSIFPRKRVSIAEHSTLASLLGRTTAVVNSLHRQAVNQLGQALTVSAREPNGVVQGIETLPPRFVLGVQWHPEYRVTENPFSRALFVAFGAACRAWAARRGWAA